MDPWLVVGLGNPGPRYAGNRHNVGAMVVDELARRGGATLTKHKTRMLTADVRLGPSGIVAVGGDRLTLAVPLSYMNESGGPVKALMAFAKIPPDRLVVVHDELDIDAATVRLKRGGGEGGHNGLRSISSALGTKDYLRVRVGIGRPPGRQDPADFVLKDFSTTERRSLPLLLDEAADAVEALVLTGLEPAQQRFHAPR